MLHGIWTFKALRADACKVEFNLRYEFSSMLLEQLIGLAHPGFHPLPRVGREESFAE